MFRIGLGFDAHRFSEEGMGDKAGKLILGGVEIPYELGLKGHSDADVLSHAICDALLGAIGEGDIGSHFPDSDPKYRGVSSLIFIEEAITLVRKKNYEVENIDTVIICERPKLSPFISDMKKRLATLHGLTDMNLGIKATTTDKMGFTGRGEGIAAQAVALIREISGD